MPHHMQDLHIRMAGFFGIYFKDLIPFVIANVKAIVEESQRGKD